MARRAREVRHGRLRSLVCHHQEEQERELLDIVAVGYAVVPEDVAVVPELLDDGGEGYAFRSFLVLVARLITRFLHSSNALISPSSSSGSGISMVPRRALSCA